VNRSPLITSAAPVSSTILWVFSNNQPHLPCSHFQMTAPSEGYILFSLSTTQESSLHPTEGYAPYVKHSPRMIVVLFDKTRRPGLVHSPLHCSTTKHASCSPCSRKQQLDTGSGVNMRSPYHLNSRQRFPLDSAKLGSDQTQCPQIRLLNSLSKSCCEFGSYKNVENKSSSS
jgi:hypothetical protein